MIFHHRFAFLSPLALALSMSACSGSDAGAPADPSPSAAAPPETPPAPDAAVTAPADAGPPLDASRADQDAGKPACNALVNAAQDVPIVRVAAEPPPPAGGAIADGVYIVTGARVYTGAGGAEGATGQTVRMTVKVVGAHAESVFDGITRSADLEIDGDKLTSTTTCPGSGKDEVRYSADGASLTLYLIDAAGMRVYSLDKQ